jgi:glycosyltransferase involved in cell wall biosynthesis
VVVPGAGTFGARCERLGLPVREVPLPRLRPPGPRPAGAVLAMRRLVRDTGAVLVHANGSRAMLYAGLAARLTGRPCVWHVRVLEPDPPLDWVLARLATRIVAISDAVRMRFGRSSRAAARSTVVPNGIDLGAFVPARSASEVRAELGLPAGARVVGSVGRLVPYKGYAYLLDAFARLRGKHPDVRLLLVGDGPERASLERQARAQGVEADARLAGHREDVADLVQVMDVFVLPSVAEHFGRVLLEAMALARPIVATAAGGVPEIVRDGATGLLVPPRDALALATAVGALLDDPARADALGRAGRQRVRDFTIERHAALMEAVFLDALERGR